MKERKPYVIEEYINAQKSGEKEYKKQVSRGEYPFLPALDDVLPDADKLTHRNVGVAEIPVGQIVGTKTRARQNSFAPNFLPILGAETEFAYKWGQLYKAQLDEGFLHPIKVYEYMHKFYVLEGNKRVSVSKYIDMPYISADIIRIIPTDDCLEDKPAYREFLEFFRVCPIYDIICSDLGSYKEIAKIWNLNNQLDEGVLSKETCKELQTAYWKFQSAVESAKIIPSNSGHITANEYLGDAFAMYLKIYGKSSLESLSNKKLDDNVKKIHKELATALNKDKLSLVESAEETINVGSIISRMIPSRNYSKQNPLKAAWVYEKSAKESVWTYNHDSGRHRLEQTYKGVVKTKHFRNKNTSVAIERAVAWGADVVFTISPTQMEATLRAAIEHENVKFLNCSVNLTYQSVRTYYAKLYEAKFLAGAAAAIATDNHMIGYCTDYPIYGTIAGINAFAIGAAMIDPDAKIYLEWSTKPDTNWNQNLQDKGIHVISAADSTHSVNGDNAVGVYRVEDDGSITKIVAPIWKWGKMYDIIIKTILDGTYNAKLVAHNNRATNYWWGMISGVVDIAISENVPVYTRKLIENLRHDVISGELNPFDWVIRDQHGDLRNGLGETLSSMDIITMDWLVENVVGEIPTTESLNKAAQAAVNVSGVMKD